jgi:hypothetical protein
MVGDLPRLDHPSGQNSSYTLEFWGTTLDCVTKNPLLERPVLALNTSDNEPATWAVLQLVTEGLNSPIGEDFLIENATFTHRKLGHIGTYQYYPCSVDPIGDLAIDTSSSHPMLSEIRVLVPIIETTCYPKLVRYIVVISHGGGAQNITYSIKDGGSVLDYKSKFEDFHGTFEQFVQFSDAFTLYRNFAWNLNMSETLTTVVNFKFPKQHQTTQSQILDNGTVVQTCSLQIPINTLQQTYGGSEIWRLSMFERRLYRDDNSSWTSNFHPKLTTELLINTAISALTLNDRFDIVNGTGSRNFNIYHFQHRLTCFLPYGLALGLAIPIIALGFSTAPDDNHGAYEDGSSYRKRVWDVGWVRKCVEGASRDGNSIWRID